MAMGLGVYPETAQFYDLFGGSQAESLKRIAFVSRYLKNKSSHVIDIGAGTGEMAFALADEGYSVSCFEPSASMHAILLDRLINRKDLQSQISIFPCFLETVEKPLNADGAYAFSVFSHVSNEKRLSMLKGVYYHLKLGGLFMFNCVQDVPGRVDQPLAMINEKKIGKLNYQHFAASKKIDDHHREVIFQFEVKYGAQVLKRYEDRFTLGLDTVQGVEELLKTAGFRIAECYSDSDRTPYSEESPGFTIVASRA